MRTDHDTRMERVEMRMVRWMCGASLSDRQPSAELRRRVGVEAIGDVIRRSRLRWYGHVERKDDEDWVKGCTKLVVEGTAPVGRPRKTWQNSVSADLNLMGIDHRDARDRVKWKRAIGRKANPAEPGNTASKRRR